MPKNFFYKILKNPYKIFTFFTTTGILNCIPDKNYLNLLFKGIFSKGLNFEKPKTFNEKLQWLKLYDRKPEYTQMVDKYSVRDYISKKIGTEYLIPLLGVWNSFEEINFDKLPDQFVLKTTHDSGGVLVCTDKNQINWKKERKKIKKKLKKNFYYVSREWPYKNVKPRIIAEKFMIDTAEEELKDYKFMCFNGKIKCSFVCSERFSKEGVKVTFFDTNWQVMPFERHYQKSKNLIERPANYDEMVRLAEILSKGISFVRIDFYEIDGKTYFGEITFYPGGGFEEFTPKIYDKLLGDWINLPKEIF